MNTPEEAEPAGELYRRNSHLKGMILENLPAPKVRDYAERTISDIILPEKSTLLVSPQAVSQPFLSVSSLEEVLFPFLTVSFYGSSELNADGQSLSSLDYLSFLLGKRFLDSSLISFPKNRDFILYELDFLNDSPEGKVAQEGLALRPEFDIMIGELCLFNNAVIPLYHVFGRRDILDESYYRYRGRKAYLSASRRSEPPADSVYASIGENFQYFENGIRRVTSEIIFPYTEFLLRHYKAYKREANRKRNAPLKTESDNSGGLRYIPFPKDSRSGNLPGAMLSEN